jgi:aminopeptidase N
VPPYVSGQGWLAHPPGYYGEHQVYEAADFSVQFQLTNAQTAWTVAASAPGDSLEGGYRYEMTGARSFALSASPDYVAQSRQVGGTTVTSYTFPMDVVAGERVLQTTAESLELFSELFGPYPHAGLAVVEADFLDGMEYSGLFFLSKGFYNLSNGTPADFLIAIAAHETAHQWWFDSVGNDQALQPWLDEALCTYAERIYFERLYPNALSWWWTYRVNYYEPRGPVDDTIYNPRREAEAYRSYRDAVYLNGAVFLEELRALIGDPAFFAFLAEYAEQYRGRIATTEGFFSLLDQYTDADIQPLVERYFYGDAAR